MDFPPIHDTLKDIYEKLPILDIGNKMGWTDYIDFIKAPENTDTDNEAIYATAPIMRGIDAYSRPFVTFKIDVYDPETDRKWQEVGTFFQRYTNDIKNWAFGTCYPRQVLYDDSRVRISDYGYLTERLRLLISGTTLNSMFPTYDGSSRIRGSGKYIIALST